MNKITIKDVEISITGISEDDYICISDIAKRVCKYAVVILIP